MSNHEGHVAIVTGAASGIGRATAELLAAAGASVVAVDLDESKLSWTESHDRVLARVGDVASADDNASWVEAAQRCRRTIG